jgi:ABC-2 type transport system permease protein
VADAVALFGLYRRLVGAHVRSQLQYRLSFALNFLGVGLITLLDFIAILIIFEQVPALGGWTVEEVALLYGIAGVAFGLADLAIGHLDLFPNMIREGTFDQILVRPLPSLFQVVASDFALRRLGKIAQSLAVLIFALVQIDVNWDAGRVAVLPVAVLAGTVIYAAVWVGLATVAFWIVDAIEFVNAFTYGGNFLSQYPLNVFARWLRSLVLFVIPISFVAYFPALYILDKPDELGLPDALRFASPAVALLTALAAHAAWSHAVRHYRSAGG